MTRRGVAILFAGLVCNCRICPSAEQSPAPMPPLSEGAPVRIVDGPTVLYANAAGEWGGHTFSYLITGKKYLFWAGMLYEPGRTSRTMLTGQYPKKDVDSPPVVTTISLDA